MKRVSYRVLYMTVASLSFFCMMLGEHFSDGFSAVIAFPFEQIGWFLRWLSLSGAAGNVIAWILYAALCLIPVAVFLHLWRIRPEGRQSCHENWLLLILSAVLFAVMYWMINPGLLGELYAIGAKRILGCVVYAVLIAYLVLCVVRAFRCADTERLQKYMQLMLAILGLVFAVIITGVCPARYYEESRTLREANTHVSTLNECFLLIRFVVYTFPYVMDSFLVDAAGKLLKVQGEEPYSEAAALAADRLSQKCVRYLTVTVLLNLGMNVLQLLFIQKLNAVKFTLEIPLFSMGLALAALLFARYIRRTKELKEENELYI